MTRVFVCYARENEATVLQIVDILRDAGQEPWFDSALLPGQKWKEEILNKIGHCEVFLYALSPESVASYWCQWEYAEAVKMSIPVIPVLLQKNTAVPDALSETQYVDFSEGFTPVPATFVIQGEF